MAAAVLSTLQLPGPLVAYVLVIGLIRADGHTAVGLPVVGSLINSRSQSSPLGLLILILPFQ